MKWRSLAALAWRESRFARRRLFLFLSSITLGVAALVATESFAEKLAEGVRDQARVLLGADVTLFSREPFRAGTTALLDSMRAAGAPTATLTSFLSMALHPATGGTRLAQVRAVDGPYPLYGQIETRPAGAWARLRGGRNVLVDPALLVALGANAGDSISLGRQQFQILGTLEKVPGDVDIASAFAPRIYVPARYIRGSGLLDFGSRAEFQAFLRLPVADGAAQWVERHDSLLASERVRARTAADRQESLGDTLARLGSFLSLIGVFALLLGGIGVASAMGAYMAQKADTVATLRCLGATARQVIGVYLLQALFMGFAGAVVGAALGTSAQWVLPRLLAGLLPVEVDPGIEWTSVLLGVAVGVWTALAFVLLPLLATRRISPLSALRRRVEPPRPGRPDAATWAAWAALGASVLLIAVLQARDLRVGAAFAGGITATLALLWLVARGVVWAVRRLPTTRWRYTLRQGTANLYRPGNQTPVVLLALGFGVFLLCTLLLVQHNLLRPLRVGNIADRANLLLWDVQPDQQPGVEALLGQSGFPVIQQAPIVPMRVAALNGRDVRATGFSDRGGGAASNNGAPEGGPGPAEGEEPEGWAVRREYRSTYRDSLMASERLIEGSWWGETKLPDGVSPVSLERDIAADLGVGVGDRITWDVQGVEVPSVVTSIRAVDWARFEPNFFAVFPRETLAGAPHTWVMLSRAPTAPQRARLQRDLVQRFPNIAAIDLTQVQEVLDAVIGRVSAAIRFLAAFSIATGFVVLLGAIATGRLQRIRESVLLKTLGATRRQIAEILSVEYLLLGLLSVVAGLLLAIVGGWALARWLFEVDFAVPAAPLLILGAVVVALAVAVGLAASREVFRTTPLQAIREE